MYNNMYNMHSAEVGKLTLLCQQCFLLSLHLWVGSMEKTTKHNHIDQLNLIFSHHIICTVHTLTAYTHTLNECENTRSLYFNFYKQIAPTVYYLYYCKY